MHQICPPQGSKEPLPAEKAKGPPKSGPHIKLNRVRVSHFT
jgi:hypothetical protein